MEIVDYLRLLAAFSVVAFHYLYNGIHNGKVDSTRPRADRSQIAQYGYLGVNFFFMISGYVIFASVTGKTRSSSPWAAHCASIRPSGSR